MRSTPVWLALALAVATILCPLAASAQGRREARALDEVAATDRRIGVAGSLLPDEPGFADAELALARQWQARAHDALAAGRPGIALRATLEARTHADRAIANVRGLPDPDRVLLHLERTSELADWARERLANCADTRAQSLLGLGLDMQDRADLAAHEGRFLAALQLTNNARERIQGAMQLCNVTRSVQETAERSLRKTDEMLTNAKGVLEQPPPEEAGRDLRRAFSMQSDARAAFEAGQFEKSVRITQDARVPARRILRGGPPAGAGPPARRPVPPRTPR